MSRVTQLRRAAKNMRGMAWTAVGFGALIGGAIGLVVTELLPIACPSCGRPPDFMLTGAILGACLRGEGFYAWRYRALMATALAEALSLKGGE